ncbi:hypothetical protein GCM10017673_46990 [Streptosporangium violaceochromogenes]|nr:hypothetical protein GCM10017673_46990 [Streptosporangium violaceochromogenes]
MFGGLTARSRSYRSPSSPTTSTFGRDVRSSPGTDTGASVIDTNGEGGGAEIGRLLGLGSAVAPGAPRTPPHPGASSTTGSRASTTGGTLNGLGATRTRDTQNIRNTDKS